MRSRWFIVSGAFLAVIVILGIWLGISGGGGSPHQTTNRSQPHMPATSAPRRGSSGCKPTDRSQEVPTTTPSGVTWQLWETFALPYSKTAGPLIVDGDIARCYAHTPTGALLAATQIPVRHLFSVHEWRQVTLAQVAPSRGHDAALAGLAVDPPKTPATGDYGQFAGFKFVNYSPSVATIDLVTRFASGAMQMESITVAWQSGDWKEVVQPNGADAATGTAVASLSDFALWGGT